MYLNIEKAVERKGTGVSSKHWRMMSMLMCVEIRIRTRAKYGNLGLLIWMRAIGRT
jgi:hypothetical protein